MEPAAASTTFLATDGDGYELNMGRWSRRLASPFVEFAAIGAAQRILDVGLRDVVEETLCVRMEFTSFADFWAPCLGRDGPAAEYVGRLDDASRNRLRLAVEAAYLDGEADGPRSYASLAWSVRGTVPLA